MFGSQNAIVYVVASQLASFIVVLSGYGLSTAVIAGQMNEC
jgi:hypothetical protein